MKNYLTKYNSITNLVYKLFHSLVFVTVFLPVELLAYVGPGAGITAIGTVIALLGAIVLAIIGFVWYPVKRLMKKKNAGKKDESEGVDNQDKESP